MKNMKTMADQPFRSLIVDFFNLVIGNSGAESEHFWKVTIKTQLAKQFYEALSAVEQDKDFYLFSFLDPLELFERLEVNLVKEVFFKK